MIISANILPKDIERIYAEEGHNIAQHMKKEYGLQFENTELLIQAFTHPSFKNDFKNFHFSDYQRLEFLGDAIVDQFVSYCLFNEYTSKHEGEMTKLRAQLVCEESLSYVARKLNFDHFLVLGKGTEQTGGRNLDSLLADTFEAFVGAMFLDCGSEQVNQFLERVLWKNHEYLLTIGFFDYKTKFQEVMQSIGDVTISYVYINEDKALDEDYCVELYVDSICYGKGYGKNKKKAEQDAARNALELLNIEDKEDL